MQLLRKEAALGYADKDLVIIASTDLANARLSVHQQVSLNTALAFQTSYARATNSSLMEVAASHALDAKTTVRAKVDTKGLLTFGVTQLVRPGVKVTMAAQMSSAKLESQKVGLSVNFE